MPSVKPSERSFGEPPDCGQLRNDRSALIALIQDWRGRDGNDPSVDIAKDADQRF